MIQPVALLEDELKMVIEQYTRCSRRGGPRGGPIGSKTNSRIWFLSQGIYITRVVTDSKGNCVYNIRCERGLSRKVQPTPVGPFTIRLFNKIWEVKQIEKPNLECLTRHPHIPNPIKKEDHPEYPCWTPYVEDETQEFTLNFVIVSLVGPAKGKSLQEQLTLWN